MLQLIPLFNIDLIYICVPLVNNIDFFLSIDIASIGVIDNVLYVIPHEELIDQILSDKGLPNDTIEMIKDHLNVMEYRRANGTKVFRPCPRF